MTNEQQNFSEGPGRCLNDGLCSECADAPPGCENCGNGLDDNRIVDETDPGIKYCSPECRAEFVAAAERAHVAEGLMLQVRVSPEALSLFAPLAPCPECRRPLPVPFNDDYRHWAGCSIAERAVT